MVFKMYNLLILIIKNILNFILIFLKTIFVETEFLILLLGIEEIFFFLNTFHYMCLYNSGINPRCISFSFSFVGLLL